MGRLLELLQTCEAYQHLQQRKRRDNRAKRIPSLGRLGCFCLHLLKFNLGRWLGKVLGRGGLERYSPHLGHEVCVG